jgi:hypothetical protein
MAEEIKSTFGEVLEVRVDAPLFEQELNKLAQVYNKWVQSLGANAKDVIGAGTVSTFNAEMQESFQLLTAMSTQSFTAIENLGQLMVDFVQKTDNVLETIAGRQVERSKKVAQEAKKSAEEMARTQDSSTGRVSSLSSAQKIDEEQAGVIASAVQAFERFRQLQNQLQVTEATSARERAALLEQQLRDVESLITSLREEEADQADINKAIQQQVSLTRQLATERKRISSEDLREEENARTNLYQHLVAQEQDVSRQTAEETKNRAQMYEALAEEQKALDEQEFESRKRLYETLSEQERLAAKQEEADRFRLFQTIVAQEEAQLSLEREIAEARRQNNQRVRPGENIDAAQTQANIDNIRREAQERQRLFNIELEQDRLRRKDQLNGAGNDLEKRVSVLQQQTKEIIAQTSALREQGGSERELMTLEKERASIQTQLNGAQANLQKSQAGFFEKFNTNLFGSIVGLTRMTLTIRLLGAAMEGLSKVVEAPFKAVFSGVEYLKQTETQATSLVATLLQTVRLSKDETENMKKVQESALAVVQEFQDVGAKLNIKPDVLLNTFKALLEGGVGKYVDNLKDATKITVQFQQALNAVGAGGLVAQTSVQEVSKLLLGVPGADSPFLKALGLAGQPGTWIKIREQAKQTGDLIGAIADRSQSFSEALKASGKTQEAMLGSTKLLLERISGLAANTLFDTISKGLMALQDFITAHQSEIVAFLKSFADDINAVFVAFKGFGDSGILQTVGLLFMFISKVVATTVVTVVQLAKGISALIDASITLASGGGLKKAGDQLKAFFDNAKESYAALFEGIKDTDKKKSDILADKFKDINTNTGKQTTAADISGVYAAQKEQLERQLKEIEERFAAMRDKIRLAVDEGQISQVEALRRTTSLISSEAAAYGIVEAKLRDVARQALSSAKGLGVSDPEGSKREVSKFTKELDALAIGDATRRNQLRKLEAAAERAAAKEGIDLLKLNSEEKRRAIEDQAKAELAVKKELAQQGYLTEVQVFDAETQVDQLRHNQQVERLNEEIATFGDGTKRKTELQNQLADENRKFNAQEDLRSKERIRIEEQETVRILNNLKAQHEASLDRQQENLETLKKAEPGLDLTQKFDSIISLREKENRLLIDSTQARLAHALALGTETKKAAELQSQLDGLYGTQNKLLQQRIENGIAGISNPAIRQFRTQQIIRQDEQEKNAGTLNTSTTGRVALGEVARSFRDLFLGNQTVETFKNATSAVEKFGVGVAAGTNAFTTVINAINAFKQGKAQGGVLGGIGAVASSLGGLPVIGPYAAAIGSALSLIGGLFTAAAKRIAEDIKKSFQKTIDNYQNGNATLIETLNAVERERTDAISRLSGKKGGKDELDKILPEFDQEIASLKLQQKQIVEGFEASLSLLRIQSDTLAQVEKQWTDINKQVKDYLDAGGNAAKAQEFLALSLAKIRQDAQDQLDQSEQDAIQDALKLNDLLTQRNKLNEDFAKQEFDLINADALERKQAGAVTRGKELADLRAQHQKDLDAINDQIKQAQVRVDKETKVFNLATDITALHRRDEELTLKALDEQIQKYKDLKDVASGVFSLTPTAAVSNYFNQTYTFNVNVNSDSGKDTADQFMDAFYRATRQAPLPA